jgi:hypothetical protein
MGASTRVATVYEKIETVLNGPYFRYIRKVRCSDNQRAQIFKREADLSLFDPKREEEILRLVTEENEGCPSTTPQCARSSS